MGRVCKVCMSLHRKEYEDLRLRKHLTLKEIQQYALNKYGEYISIASLSRHFRRDVEPLLKAMIEADKQRHEIVREEISKDIKIAAALRENLEILKSQMEEVIQVGTPEARREARDIISRINDTVALLLKFSDKIKIEEAMTEEEMFKRLLYAIEPLPADLIVEIRRRWEEYPNVKDNR